MKTAVIVVNWNQEEATIECLQSLRQLEHAGKLNPLLAA